MNLMVINNSNLYLHRTLHLPFPQNILFDLSDGHVKKKYTKYTEGFLLTLF